MNQVDLSAHAQLGARLETLVGDGQSVRAVVAWLSNGEFVMALRDDVLVEYATTDTPGGAMELDLRLRAPSDAAE